MKNFTFLARRVVHVHHLDAVHEYSVIHNAYKVSIRQLAEQLAFKMILGEK